MDAIYEFDFAILDALQTIHNPFLNIFLGLFSYIGEGGILWIALSILCTIIKKTRAMGYAMMLSLSYVGIFNELLIKNIIKRERPFTLRPEIDVIVYRPSSYSFPSGHTCTSFACSTAIFCFNKKLGVAAYIVSALIGFSRNYFFVHFPTDVLCGMLEGIILGILASLIVKRISEKIKAKKELTPPPEE